MSECRMCDQMAEDEMAHEAEIAALQAKLREAEGALEEGKKNEALATIALNWIARNSSDGEAANCARAALAAIRDE